MIADHRSQMSKARQESARHDELEVVGHSMVLGDAGQSEVVRRHKESERVQPQPADQDTCNRDPARGKLIAAWQLGYQDLAEAELECVVPRWVACGFHSRWSGHRMAVCRMVLLQALRMAAGMQHEGAQEGDRRDHAQRQIQQAKAVRMRRKAELVRDHRLHAQARKPELEH